MPEPRDPEDPRDDDNSGGGDASPLIIAILSVIAGVLIVLSVVGFFTSRDTTPPPSISAMCTESCWGFLKLECPTNRLMGVCFGWPSCGGIPHPCGKDQ